DVSNEHAFGPRFTADPSLSLVPASASLAVNALAAAVAPVPHRLDRVPGVGEGQALTPDDIAELAHILDEVETRFAGDFVSGLISESPAKLRRMVDYFRAINGDGSFPRPRCNSPHISTVIEVDGTLRPCYFLPAYGQ